MKLNPFKDKFIHKDFEIKQRELILQIKGKIYDNTK